MRNDLVVASLLAAGLSVVGAQTTVPVYGQCGGIGYTGSTVCATGSTCVYSNDWYSQCLPGAATSTSTTSKAVSTTTTSKVSSTSKTSSTTVTSKASTSTTSKASTSTTSKASTTSSSSSSSSTGYVKTSGTKFTLNSQDYVPVGTNAYWMAQLGSEADIVQAFSELAAAGYNTVRTLGFNDVTDPNTYGTWYQLWANGVGTINTGANGLARFDFVVSTAISYGIRLLVTLTNNWTDYGGMDLYVSQILGSGQTHDVFYTNAAVQAAYQKYVSEFVGRYVNSPGIMAWELANEPRCAGTSTSASSTCTTATITQWASTMSAYIKSIDPNHLVAIGDEGFFNEPGNAHYVYQGSLGIDFVANLAVSTLDFGTFHMYPESWGEAADSVAFGNMWITDHANAGKNASKPVIIEEYGVTVNQSATYTTWGQTMVSSGLTGELYWQAGTYLADGTFYYGDVYSVYPNSTDYAALVQVAAELKARG